MSLCVLLLILAPPLLVGLYGLVDMFLSLAVVQYHVFWLDLLDFLIANLAFSFFMVACTGVSIDFKPTGFVEGLKFWLAFACLYILSTNVKKIRKEVAARLANKEES